MSYSQRFGKLAGTIGKPEEEEPKIAMSFRATESIAASLNSISKATGVSKNEILNQVLDIALVEFCEALESRTDLIIEVRDDAYPVFEFFSPAHARQVRSRFGDAVQLDLEDAIEQEQKQKLPSPKKGKK